ncbi:hypothetical protein N340_09839, partial [Tauraco erythrolophus]
VLVPHQHAHHRLAAQRRRPAVGGAHRHLEGAHLLVVQRPHHVNVPGLGVHRHLGLLLTLLPHQRVPDARVLSRVRVRRLHAADPQHRAVVLRHRHAVQLLAERRRVVVHVADLHQDAFPRAQPPPAPVPGGHRDVILGRPLPVQ